MLVDIISARKQLLFHSVAREVFWHRAIDEYFNSDSVGNGFLTHEQRICSRLFVGLGTNSHLSPRGSWLSDYYSFVGLLEEGSAEVADAICRFVDGIHTDIHLFLVIY